MQLRNVPNEYKGILNAIRRKAKRCNVRVRFGIGNTVHFDDSDIDGQIGYFTGIELAVAIGSNDVDEWMRTLIHESCHLDQEYDKKISDEQRERWDKASLDYNDWLLGKKQVNDAQLMKIIDGVVELELDCERRSIAKIRKWKLPINISEYIQMANVYLYCHYAFKDYRKFYLNYSINRNIFEKAAKTFQRDYKNIPYNIKRAIQREIDREESEHLIRA